MATTWMRKTKKFISKGRVGIVLPRIFFEISYLLLISVFSLRLPEFSSQLLEFLSLTQVVPIET